MEAEHDEGDRAGSGDLREQANRSDVAEAGPKSTLEGRGQVLGPGVRLWFMTGTSRQATPSQLRNQASVRRSDTVWPGPGVRAVHTGYKMVLSIIECLLYSTNSYPVLYRLMVVVAACPVAARASAASTHGNVTGRN